MLQMVTSISLRFSSRRFVTDLIGVNVKSADDGKRKRDEHRNPIRRETVERDTLYIVQFCTWRCGNQIVNQATAYQLTRLNVQSVLVKGL